MPRGFMHIPLVDLKTQYYSIKEEIDQVIFDVIQDSAFIGGKYAKVFEQNFADYVGVKNCVGVGNGTDALYIALKEKYNHEFEGVNSRLDGLQAAILDVKLKYLDKWTERRRTIAKMYDTGLKDVVITPSVLPDVKHVYHLYVIRIKNRDRVKELLAEKGIATGIHYPIPLPFLKAYSYLGHKPADFPVAYSIKDEILSLPIHGDMTDEQVEYVIDSLKDIVNKM